MKKLHRIVILALVSLSLVLVGCARATEAPPQGEPTSTTPSDAQEAKVITGTARVEAIEILILESFPVQVNVVARGNLPDGCTTIDRIEQERDESVFVITITTVRPAEQMCTEALVPFEEVISLDVAGLKAGTYTVDVNGVRDTFELTVDNRLPDEGRVPGAPGEDGAREHRRARAWEVRGGRAGCAHHFRMG